MERDGGRSLEFDWEMLLPEAEDDFGDGGVAGEAEADAETEGLMMLRLDHFSIDNNMEFSRSVDKSDLSSDGASVESDNPSWVDPSGSEAAAAFRRRNSVELWPDWASERSKLSDCGDRIGLGFVESGGDRGFGVVNHGILGYDSGGDSAEFEGEFQDVENMNVFAENYVEKMDAKENMNEEMGNGSGMGVEGEGNLVAVALDGSVEEEVEQPIEVEKKSILWWKLPLELVKLCIFKVSPLWSISVAAAMVGVFIMRRRLHMMRKTKSMQMKVTVDHKKVDQFMSRAARLNEAFSVVRHVPIIRPSLPAPGLTSWPVMSIR